VNPRNGPVFEGKVPVSRGAIANLEAFLPVPEGDMLGRETPVLPTRWDIGQDRCRGPVLALDEECREAKSQFTLGLAHLEFSRRFDSLDEIGGGIAS